MIESNKCANTDFYKTAPGSFLCALDWLVKQGAWNGVICRQSDDECGVVLTFTGDVCIGELSNPKDYKLKKSNFETPLVVNTRLFLDDNWYAIEIPQWEKEHD